jgi:beta-galactosidase
MLHSSMLPAGGETSPGWDGTVRLGQDLARLAEIAGSRCAPAEVALLIDWDSWWALEDDGHPSDALRLRDLCLRMYRPLRTASVPVEMRHPEDDLSGYRVVVAPNLFLLSPKAAANLATFIADGGLAIIGPFSGIVASNCERGDGAHPSLLRDVVGIAVDEWWPVPGGDVGITFEDGSRYRATLWREAIRPASAETIARFDDAPLAGRPAITRNALGLGQAWYVGTVPDGPAMTDLVGRVLSAAGVRSLGVVPDGVQLLRRDGDEASYLFVANRTDEPVLVPVGDARGVDLLTGTRVEGELRLDAQGVAVVRIEAAGLSR